MSKPPPRKGLRVGHVSERGGINAVRSLLEANGLVVDEVDGRADYGRDLNVDLTNASRVTAGIIGVQVKGGRSFYRKGRWVIPASPTDWEYWRSSTLPVIGMTWDPDTQIIHWVNLTQHARARVLISDTGYGFELQNDQAAHVVAEQVLTQSTFGDFLNEVNKYLRATSSSAFLDLLSGDDETRRRGVYACWTLGRRDPRPLILLRNLLPRMHGVSLSDGITVLAHATPHPDIFWTSRNWISKPVEEEVQAAMRWSPSELVSLVYGVEQLDPEFVGWQRGGLGQSLWSIIAVDPGALSALRISVKLATEERKLDTAVRLLICFQWLAANPREDLRELLAETPALNGHEWVNGILQAVDRYGRVEIY